MPARRRRRLGMWIVVIAALLAYALIGALVWVLLT
jgi:hypothetical protein